ncbi:hypothetical protein QFZ79_001059 [Arthrobacter sp. V4I6]|nr:hypothetical protein [Arthrobacter sp. V1I7]MDQ0852948.1 hypothetical protein [Arthrobacter sp. V4I6]
MKSRGNIIFSVSQRNAPISKVIAWAAGCLLRCAADVTAQILQDTATRGAAGSPSTTSPQGKL